MGDAADRLLGLHGVEPLTEEVVLRNMAPQFERWLRRQVGETDFGYLGRIMDAGEAGNPEFGSPTPHGSWVSPSPPQARWWSGCGASV